MRYAHYSCMTGDETLREWGANIRSLRLTLNPDGTPRRTEEEPVLTPARLGALLNPPVAQSTVSRWERGLIEPSRHNKVQLATILMTDVRMLFPLTRSTVAS